MQRKYFLRANTSSGLVNLTENNLERIDNLYILTGKSKFFKSRILSNIAKYTDSNVKNQECAVSPFDISQLDAVILRDEKTAVVDADCLTEKKRGIIIDTSDFISPFKIKKYEKMQEELISKAQEALLGMYSAYAGAKIIHDEWEKLYIENIDFDRLNKFEEGLLESLIVEKSQIGTGIVLERFFGASTPDGSVNYIDNLTEGLKTRYFIKGRPGTGKSTFMKKLKKKAQDFNYNSEIYYCSFDKNSLDMVVIPELSFCVFDSTAPHELFPTRDTDLILDFYKESGLSGIDEKYEKEFSEIQRLYSFRITEGITKLRLSGGYQKEAECYFELSGNKELADKAADKIVRKILT
ncbi:MAG: hypothetical protein K5768_05715 [Firmicutes bacterium]|nr:hypothetical protein [Bacillota bacterium]